MSARSCLLLQGLNHHRPAGHWQYWVADRLRDRGERVLYPGLPFEDAPRVEEWTQALHWLLRQMAEGEGERVVVCNSLSGLLWLRFAAQWPGDLEPVDRLLLVATPDSPRVPDAAASFRLDGIDAAAVRESVRSPIRLVCSDGDPYNPGRADRQYAGPLQADVDVIAGAGHLGPVEGYGPWPSLLAWCEDPAQRIVANLAA
jgi:predicted alpha/beta hydrolase family esterase